MSLQKFLPRIPAPSLPPEPVSLTAALALVLLYNLAFWHRLLAITGTTSGGISMLPAAAGFVLWAIFFSFFTLLSFPRIFKATLILAIFLAAPIAWFSTCYGSVIDCHMISNTLETDWHEAGELITPGFLFYLVFAALLPALLCIRLRLKWQPPLRQLRRNLLISVCVLFVAGGVVYLDYSGFALVGRQHRYLRMYINPTYALYSVGKYYRQLHPVKIVLRPLAKDAHLAHSRSRGRKRLGILVVGESARAREFALNGYHRPTNPELAHEKGLVSFTQAYASATSTAEAVPCMFSHLKRKEYTVKKAAAYENLLDILQRLGIGVFWRDNNSSSKGVADRVDYRRLKVEDIPAVQRPELINNGEIYDEALLCQVPEIITRNPGRDLLIILHQKGSHGPAYYRRHPEKFTRFKPEYRGTAPQNARRQELVNAYDNTILYTDHFLARCITLLKQHSPAYDTFLFYMSDHGESLGEKGIYLHGLPWLLAPDEQKHIGAVVWLSQGLARSLDISIEDLKKRRKRPISHDWIFSSILRLYGVETSLYEPAFDLFATPAPTLKQRRSFQ